MTQIPTAPPMNPRPRKPIDTETYEGRFAVRLKMLREKAGLTAEELAEALGVHFNTVYHWERSHSFPQCRQLPLLAEALKLKGVRTLFPEK